MAHYLFSLSEIGEKLNGPLVVVMPVYNEEANIARVIVDWVSCLEKLSAPFQIVTLNDGSRDRTQEILLDLEKKQPEVLCVLNKPNSGHGITCRMGYDIAINSAAEWVLQVDSDGQCDPKHFADFWTKRESHDCIMGVRKTRDDGPGRIFTSLVCRFTSSFICGQDLRDANVPYRLIRRSVLKQALTYIPPSFNIHNVALTYVLKKLPGLRWAYVDIHFPERQGGENSINVLKVVTWGLEMLLELLRIRVRPIRPAP